MLNVEHFRDHVVRPALEHVGLWSLDAEALLLGTAAQESRFRHLVQLGRGPARGFYQVEPATHDDIWRNWLAYKEALRLKVEWLLAPAGERHDQLVWNLAYSTVIARLVYRRRPEPLPSRENLPAMAAYWKRWYNTPLGRGKVTEFEKNYRELVLPWLPELASP